MCKKTPKYSVRPTRISHSSKKSGGYFAVAECGTGSKKCFFLRGGYRLGAARYASDKERIDMVITMRYCAPDVTTEMFMPMMANLAIIDDREAVKAALAAK